MIIYNFYNFMMFYEVLYKYIFSSCKKIKSSLIYIMSTKYEFLSNDEIIQQYKLIKDKERQRNKEAYNNLKTDEEKYKIRLKNALENQQQRMNKIKSDENLYNDWLINNKVIQSRSYYNRMAKHNDILIEQHKLINDFNNN